LGIGPGPSGIRFGRRASASGPSPSRQAIGFGPEAEDGCSVDAVVGRPGEAGESERVGGCGFGFGFGFGFAGAGSGAAGFGFPGECGRCERGFGFGFAGAGFLGVSFLGAGFLGAGFLGVSCLGFLGAGFAGTGRGEVETGFEPLRCGCEPQERGFDGPERGFDGLGVLTQWWEGDLRPWWSRGWWCLSGEPAWEGPGDVGQTGLTGPLGLGGSTGVTTGAPGLSPGRTGPPSGLPVGRGEFTDGRSARPGPAGVLRSISKTGLVTVIGPLDPTEPTG
jgi:hypothetical protein